MMLLDEVKVGKVDDVCRDVVNEVDVVELYVDELCSFRSDIVDDLLL